MSEVVPLFELEEKPKNATVFDEGSAGDKFYILLHGRLRVFKGDVQLAVLDAQSHDEMSLNGYPFFGEMALMDAAPRMASVHTLTPCKILSLPRSQFARFLSLVPDFKARVARTKALRKKQSELNVVMASKDTEWCHGSTLDEDGRKLLKQATERGAAWLEEEALVMPRRGRPTSYEAQREEAATRIQRHARGRACRRK